MFYIGRVTPARERATTIQLEILQLFFWYLPPDTIEFFALYTSVRALIFLRRASTCRWKYHYRFFLSLLFNQISIKNRLPFVWLKSDAFDGKQTTASIKRQSTKEVRPRDFSHTSEHCGSPSMDTSLTYELGRRFSPEPVGKKNSCLSSFQAKLVFNERRCTFDFVSKKPTSQYARIVHIITTSRTVCVGIGKWNAFMPFLSNWNVWKSCSSKDL